MTAISFPSSPKPQGMTWRLVQPAQVNISAWTGARQVAASGRGWWECDITMPPIVGESNFRAWASFIAQCRGSANEFRIPTSPNAQSALTVPVATNGVDQTGRSIATDGWPNSTTVLYAGQYVTIDNQLLMLTADVVSNGLGQATLSVEPAVRNPVADNTPVRYATPFCLMYFEETPSFSIEPGFVYGMKFTLREHF